MFRITSIISSSSVMKDDLELNSGLGKHYIIIYSREGETATISNPKKAALTSEA